MVVVPAKPVWQQRMSSGLECSEGNGNPVSSVTDSSWLPGCLAIEADFSASACAGLKKDWEVPFGFTGQQSLFGPWYKVVHLFEPLAWKVRIPGFFLGVCSSSALCSYSFHSFWSGSKRAHTLPPSETWKKCHFFKQTLPEKIGSLRQNNKENTPIPFSPEKMQSDRSFWGAGWTCESRTNILLQLEENDMMKSVLTEKKNIQKMKIKTLISEDQQISCFKPKAGNLASKKQSNITLNDQISYLTACLDQSYSKKKLKLFHLHVGRL